MQISTVTKERRLLRKIIKLSKSLPENKVPENQIETDNNRYYLDSLLKKELLWRTSIGDIQNTNTGGYIMDSYTPSTEGLHYFEKRSESVKLFLLRSIFTPIIVSAATTLITIFIHSLIEK